VSQDAAGLRRRAQALASARDFGAEALQTNRAIVEADPRDLDAWTRLAACCIAAGRYDDALQHYRAVLAIDPSHAFAAKRVRQLTLFPGVDPSKAPSSGPFTDFGGLRADDFAELGLCGDPLERFAARMNGLLDRVSAQPEAHHVALALGQSGGRLFHRGEFYAEPGHIYAYHWGGRWRPQANIGLFSAWQWSGNWVRMGLGFNLTLRGRYPEPTKLAELRRDFVAFQRRIATGHRRFMEDWLHAESGAAQVDGDRGPRLQETPTATVDLICGLSVERTEWCFVGKWLSLQSDDAVLSNPDQLARCAARTLSRLVTLVS
jgi:Tetratricopeptide repeat